MKGLLIFLTGAAAGVTGCYLYMRNKTEAYINEEIELMKEHYAEKIDEVRHETEKAVNEPKKGLKQAKNEGNKDEKDDAYYKNIINRLNYNSISNNKSVEEPVITPPEEPEVITHEEYSDCPDDWDSLHYIYFEGDAHHDPVVIDEFTNEVVDNGLDIIGRDNLDSFGSEEDGVTYIRNEQYRSYIEVTHDDRNYEDTEYYED